MNVTLLFFLLLVPISGFIAWAGDRIGHKTGKKRHSLFGLRPRHTATLITVAAGMCISLVTFGLMWASNETFRVILARGAELIQTNAELKQENETTRRQVAAKRTEIDSLDQQVHTYRTQAQAAEAAKSRAQADYRKARDASQRAHQELAVANSTLAETRSRLDKTQSALDTAQKQVADARRDFKHAQEDIALANRKRSAAETAQQLAQADTLKAQDRLTQAGRDFRLVTETQAEYLKQQRQQLKDQTDQIAEQQKTLTHLNEEVSSGQKELDKLRVTLRDFRTTTTALRGTRITYQVGEEVDRVSIPAGISVWRIEFILDSLLNSAGKKAEARGAHRLAQTARAVALNPAPLPPTDAPVESEPVPTPTMPQIARGPHAADSDTPNPDIPVITESDMIRAAAQAIRRDNRDVVVIAVAAMNAVEGEPVPIGIRTFHNPVVLTAGTDIGEVTVDGTASRQEIVDALYGFLHNDVHTRLLKAGVIPPLTDGSAAEGDASSIVTLSGDAWLKILDDVRKAGSRARVIVRVDKTTRAADPVALRFEVKRSWDSQSLPALGSGGSGGGGIAGSMALR